ncbi:OPT oligopeptide transporter protein-domain-containing protein [Blastocladiella britannica]|nr:OPT oligopeptide transporter protein-domain-containing protein [Blastocladiella britannica]
MDKTSPTPMAPPPSAPRLTARPVLLGILVGIVPVASGLYLGLKTGWGFGSTFFAVLIGFPMLRFLDGMNHSGEGGESGTRATIQEHCFLVSVSTAVANLTSAGWVNGIPALYKLGLLDPAHFMRDMVRLAIWSTTLAAFATFVALALGPHFLSRADLPFPSATGAAHLLLQMHAMPLPRTIKNAAGMADGVPSMILPDPFAEKEAQQDHEVAKSERSSSAKRAAAGVGAVLAQQRVLALCLGGAFMFLFCAHAVPVLKELHFFWYLAGGPRITGPHPADGWLGFVYQLERYNVFLTVSFAFFGAGLMMGIRSAISFFVGSFLSWFILGHFFIERLGWVPNPWIPATQSWATPARMNPAEPGVGFWLLWPGITMLVTNALADLAFSAVDVLVRSGIKTLVSFIWESPRKAPRKDEKPKPPRPWRLLLVGGFTTFMAAAVTTRATFHIPFPTACLALVIAIGLSYIATAAAAATDMNPSGTLAKVTKCVFSFLPAVPPERHMMMSMSGAMVGTGTSSQVVDLIGDYKIGSICKTPLRPQFHAQLIGSLCAAPITAAMFTLYVSAYPCIIMADDSACAAQGFPLVAANTWKVFTQAIVDPQGLATRIPPTSLQLAWAVLCVVTASSALKKWIVPSTWAWVLPQWNAVGMAMLTSRTDYALTAAVGAVMGKVWMQRSPASYELLMFTVASGLIAGEGTWGLVAAVSNVAGWKEGWLSMVGVPQ